MRCLLMVEASDAGEEMEGGMADDAAVVVERVNQGFVVCALGDIDTYGL